MCWLRAFPGEPRQVAEVRQFVASLLTACPLIADVLTCTSELAANAIRHSLSGHGGFFLVTVVHDDDHVYIAVSDSGGPKVPAIPETGSSWFEESGRGLALVGSYAACWGVEGDENGRTVWAELRRPTAV